MNATPPSTFPYVTETLALLGEQDPQAVMAATPSWLAAHLDGVPLATLRRAEGTGKWSLAEVVAHMADAEIAFGWRARIVLTQDGPAMQGFDQQKWLARFDYASADPVEALAAFTALRHWNLRVWRSATAADLQRVGIHAERGPETLDTLQRLVAGHDLRHRRQIERILRTVG